MIDFESFTLSNGLNLIVHEDHTAPLTVVNVMYNVGSRDEDPKKTGFAHLFEHLMFGGSENIPDYDKELQKVGGENNAFTNSDITNYYIQLPSVNLETALWLESDRMLQLSINKNSLEVQRKVVVEEFKQRYLNQPYGDVMLFLRSLAYQEHPYQWPTIGRDVSHIEEATLEDVKNFFHYYYSPNNAVLVIAGDVNPGNALELAEKWFGSIPAGPEYKKNIPPEPKQTSARKQTLERDIPLNAIYKAYHMPGRAHPDYFASDLISDILGRGKSSRLFNQLVRKTQLFTDINAYVTGSIDPGLLIISGKLNEEVDFNTAHDAISEIINDIKQKSISEQELNKVKNQAESTLVLAELEMLNRAINLAYFSILGDTNAINKEAENIQGVTLEKVNQMANHILAEENSNTVFYKKKEA